MNPSLLLCHFNHVTVTTKMLEGISGGAVLEEEGLKRFFGIESNMLYNILFMWLIWNLHIMLLGDC